MADRRPRKVGILTSGGDAPGMNAAIRAITRTALKEGLSVIGFYRGYEGVVNKHYTELERKSVANIVQRGGTILRSARCAEFMTPAGRDKAADNLRELGVDVLFVIGGDGSLKGALALREHWDGQVIGLPGTIDNDLDGTDYTIGYFTALDTAVHAIDKVRDTADAFERIFLVEVMGRMAGFIALGVGIGCGAEEVLVPERDFELRSLINRIQDSRATGKLSCIIVVAEGVVHRGVKSLDERITIHDSSMLAKEIQRETGLDSRAVILGHIQRGGNPAALDRMLASMLGTYAVEAALKGETDVMAGIHAQKRCLVPLAETWAERKSLDDFMLHVQHTLA
ncbi:MAG: 6-phosphofructokinase [Chromatiales bacterium]|jgi:6-phosphofructokinase 1|nr:6-phosphofructokinase [Chromatiales bacterium]